MARKARQRISYVLPLPDSTGGHRLGVNGLAVDSTTSTLYTGGRDGVLCSWNLNLDLHSHSEPPTDLRRPPTILRQQIQAHSHWINDIVLARSNELLLSASSDITVKAWRPHAEDGQSPQTVGIHSDYVKTLAVPSSTSDWVASGGLDRRISLWDVSGAGQRLSIDVSEDDIGGLSSKEQGSVYALAVTQNIICSGGPESAVRTWDSRSGKRITRLVGHTDNIRDILVSDDGSTILSASSDRTVKVWSTIAGRCLHTLTMHDSSVWSLYSTHPDLSLFYSSDKTGLVAKTDIRGSADFDDGVSVAVCQEHAGVHKIEAAGSYIWSATSRSSINRWLDVDTENAEIDLPDNYTMNRSRRGTVADNYSIRTRTTSFTPPPLRTKKIPLQHMLRLSNTAYFPCPNVMEPEHQELLSNRRISYLERPSMETRTGQPVRVDPDFSIEGQVGLVKHEMLNDRKRILTVDTSGEVVLWDLLKCKPIKSFGKRDIEKVKDELTTNFAVAHWCTVHTRTGTVSVVLEENTCFDAELYADELDLDEQIDIKEDQRINLGKWVLRYLFEGVISEEIRRDKQFRDALLSQRQTGILQREGAPMSIQIPAFQHNGWQEDSAGPLSTSTLRANGTFAPITPGLAILAASPTPAVPSSRSSEDPFSDQADSGQAEEDTKVSTNAFIDKNDYFSTSRTPTLPLKSPGGTIMLMSPTAPGMDTPTTPGAGEGKETIAKEGLFGKKFKMGVGRSFSGMKRLGRSTTKEDRTATVEEKDETESSSRSSQTSDSTTIHDNFFGCVQKIRLAYEESLQAQSQTRQAHENGLPVSRKSLELPTSITPSLPAETPVLKPPASTTILIQEDRPEAGGVADLLETTVGALESACTLVERAGPMWLADVLLRNQILVKDVVKISFVLEPLPGSNLPTIANDTNNRLNANRMLRARKILAYIAERIESPPSLMREAPEDQRLRPEEYLELWCQGQVVPPLMSLATIRSSMWRGSGDIALFYKANGRKAIAGVPPPVVTGVP